MQARVALEDKRHQRYLEQEVDVMWMNSPPRAGKVEPINGD